MWKLPLTGTNQKKTWKLTNINDIYTVQQVFDMNSLKSNE